LQSLLQKNYSDLGIDLNFVSAGTSDLGLSAGNNDVETHRYYFTSDHIGSSNVITDASGTPVQQIEYMPFGESYVDWRELSWNTPYRFTGKEQDPETGLYYYGARYYDAKIGRFMSVDPLAEKSPGWSPYTYTLNNPIRYIDPDGRAPISFDGGPDDPPSESQIYFDITREFQAITAEVGSWFSDVYASVTNVFDHPYNKKLKTSATTTATTNFEKAIMEIKPGENGEAIFSNEPFIKVETKTDALYYQTEQKKDFPINKVLSAGISSKQKISVDNGAASIQVKGTLGVNAGPFSGGGFISGSYDSNQKATQKMGIEIKAKSPNVTSTLQFGIKLDNE